MDGIDQQQQVNQEDRKTAHLLNTVSTSSIPYPLSSIAIPLAMLKHADASRNTLHAVGAPTCNR